MPTLTFKMQRPLASLSRRVCRVYCTNTSGSGTWNPTWWFCKRHCATYQASSVSLRAYSSSETKTCSHTPTKSLRSSWSLMPATFSSSTLPKTSGDPMKSSTSPTCPFSDTLCSNRRLGSNQMKTPTVCSVFCIALIRWLPSCFSTPSTLSTLASHGIWYKAFGTRLTAQIAGIKQLSSLCPLDSSSFWLIGFLFPFLRSKYFIKKILNAGNLGLNSWLPQVKSLQRLFSVFMPFMVSWFLLVD